MLLQSKFFIHRKLEGSWLFGNLAFSKDHNPKCRYKHEQHGKSSQTNRKSNTSSAVCCIARFFSFETWLPDIQHPQELRLALARGCVSVHRVDRGQNHRMVTSLRPRTRSLAPRHAGRDYFYHQESVRGTIGGLGAFFEKGQSSPCVLCEGACIDRTTSRYDLLVAQDYDRHRPDEAVLNLLRLEHLATLHTPYFAMLFVGLVENKRYTFHRGASETDSMARHLIRTLSGVTDSARSEGEELRSSAALLKRWWRYQERRSNSTVNVSTPSYFTLCTEDDPQPWTPAFDAFEVRKPEPLYSFLRDKCRYHETRGDRSSDDPRSLGKLWQGSLARVRAIPHAEAVTFVLSDAGRPPGTQPRGSGPAGGAPVRLRPRERSPTRPHLARQPNEVEIEGAHKGGAGSLEPRALPQDDILGLRRHQDFTQAAFGAARPRLSRLRESPQSRTAQTSTRWHLG
ncbi:hypothetical protein Q5P01_016595 [Channa striata]|uniref:Uncharacterized protein n=1 Tax=Channa striata TaxID=64152 RepID=A0AA88MBU0_CHASR|nr:hypothetical protein Q5P01_016595 [Channa striata]